MAFHTIGGGGKAIDIKKQTDPIVGIYQGKKDIVTKIGNQVIWNFLDEDEKPIGIYGFTSLNYKMETIKPGSLVRVTYTGKIKKETKFGLREVHQCVVEVDS